MKFYCVEHRIERIVNVLEVIILKENRKLTDIFHILELGQNDIDLVL